MPASRRLCCWLTSSLHTIADVRLQNTTSVALQELPPGLTEEQALSPACTDLVEDMKKLLKKLLGLSHLSDAGEQEASICRLCGLHYWDG